MKEYQVSDLTGNEILAKPVYLDNGNIILEMGTVLKASYKESLMSLNVQKIYVEDIYEKYEETNYYYEKKQFFGFIEELRKIVSHHIYKQNQRLQRLVDLADQMVDLFEKTKENRVLDIKGRTFDLYEHSIYTALFVMILGKEYMFNYERMKNAVLGCLLHDLGFRYITVDFENCVKGTVISKKLSELKKHTILGYSSLERENWIPDISKKMILFHHEKLDGSGYPLRQKNYPLECRMLQICDSFDCEVLGMERNNFRIHHAFNKISDIKKYDANMANILKKKVGIFPTGTFVKLSNFDTAIVISQTENPTAPVVLYTEKFNEKHPVRENLNYQNNLKIIDNL